MKQYYIDERTGISYTLQGNYYLPNLIPVSYTHLDVYKRQPLCGEF